MHTMSVVQSDETAGRLLGLALIALTATGCVNGRTVVPVRMQPAALAMPSAVDLSSHDATVRGIAGIIVRDLGLPLPATVTVYVYSSRELFEQGLVDAGGVASIRGAELRA